VVPGGRLSGLGRWDTPLSGADGALGTVDSGAGAAALVTTCAVGVCVAGSAGVPGSATAVASDPKDSAPNDSAATTAQRGALLRRPRLTTLHLHMLSVTALHPLYPMMPRTCYTRHCRLTGPNSISG
jgi:hypothetical protein